MIRDVKDKKTRVYWIPTAAECEEKRLKQKFINMTYGPKALLATQYIYTLNKDIYSILEPYLLEKETSMHGFVNLVNMSNSKSCQWSLDGVHYNSFWYSHLVWTIFGTICA